MALVKREDITEKTGLPPEGFKEAVVLRSVKATSRKSARTKRPMIFLETEIVSPKTVKGVDAINYEIVGAPVNYYIMLDDEGKYGLNFVIDELMPRLKLIPEIDPEDPNTSQFEGLYFEAIISTEKNVATKQNPDNPDEYIVIKDSKGNPVELGVTVKAFVNEILGRVDAPDDAVPF
jgi:hypothetical protein